MPATSANVLRWIEVAKSQRVSDADKALIDSSSVEGRRRMLEILFGRSFLAMDYSFHATIRTYCECIVQGKFGIHDAANVRSLLSFVHPYTTEMIDTDFIDEGLAHLLAEPDVIRFASE
jgi:hypothetical protein